MSIFWSLVFPCIQEHLTHLPGDEWGKQGLLCLLVYIFDRYDYQLFYSIFMALGLQICGLSNLQNAN